MYEIISIFNSIIRDQALPNPFEYITDNQLIAILLFSVFGSIALKRIAFTMCGIFYKSRSNRILGSIGYMFLLYKYTSTCKIMSVFSRYNFNNVYIYCICNNNVYFAI